MLFRWLREAGRGGKGRCIICTEWVSFRYLAPAAPTSPPPTTQPALRNIIDKIFILMSYSFISAQPTPPPPALWMDVLYFILLGYQIHSPRVLYDNGCHYWNINATTSNVTISSGARLHFGIEHFISQQAVINSVRYEVSLSVMFLLFTVHIILPCGLWGILSFVGIILCGEQILLKCTKLA